MQITVNKKPNNEVELTIEVTQEEFRPFLEQAAGKLAAQTSIPGFRVGKAPYEIVKERVGEMKIYEEALDPMVNTTFRKAIKEQNLNPVGLPKVQITKIALGAPVEYKATIALLPAVVVCAYDAIKVDTKEVAVADEEVEKTLEELRTMRASEALVPRPAALTDRIRLNIEMFLDTVPLEGGQAKDAVLELGKELYIPGFDAEIVGMQAGEKKEFKLRFPEKHGDKRLANKDVEFRVNVQGVYAVTRPELDETFAKGLGAFANMEDVRNKIRDNIKLDKQDHENERREVSMLEALTKKSEFGPIPDLLIDAEKDKMIVELEDMVERQGAKFADYLTSIKKSIDDIKKEFGVPAEKRVKTSLLIREVAMKEKIEVTQSEIDAELGRMRQYYKDSKEALEHLEHQHTIDWIRGNVLNQKVIQFLSGKILGITHAT